MSFERKRGEALWSQIANELARDIKLGLYQRDEKLPTEMQLAERYGVNRHTIRRALDELANARIIRTEHGRGSFVNEEVLDYRIGQRPRFSEWVRSHNRTPLGNVLQLEEFKLEALPEAGAAAEALQIALDDQVILLERIGMADDIPLSLTRHIFPVARLPGLLDALRSHGSVTAALASIGIGDYTRRWTRVCARMPDARETRLLRMARTDALLACEDLNASEDGTLLEFGTGCYPAPRVQLVFET
ncbi:MAG TPA: phosphonate metabolism transcriptional regulator PhnF [Bradyrhizobium sp.]|nr:phosphonate metabolism transcriptional regulator PhnF [Bradyrhizobium sp.]